MNILLLSCGGTIVSTTDDEPDVAGRTASAGASAELLDQVMTQRFLRALEQRAKQSAAPRRTDVEPRPTVTALDLLDKDSTEVGPEDWKLIISTIVREYDRYDGFIIIHGTNSLAYTASALTFGLPLLGKPIVMTGANVPMGVPYSDAVFNTANAVLLVQKLVSESRTGVVVVFASRIIPGVRAKKSNGTELEAFRTFNASDIGQMRPKEIVHSKVEHDKYTPWLLPSSPWYRREPARDASELAANVYAEFGGVISSHTFHPGDNPRTYNAVLNDFVEMHAETDLRGALIIRAVGDGDLSALLKQEALKRAVDFQVPVVVTTQEPQGTSSFKGNLQSKDADLLRLIPAWDMSIETMVVKLRYLFGQRASYMDIYEQFTKSFFGEITVRVRD